MVQIKICGASNKLTVQLTILLVCILGCSFVCLCDSAQTAKASKAEEDRKLKENIGDIDLCVTQSIYSFMYKYSYPPTTLDALRDNCKFQTQAHKCVKDKSRVLPGILKRGVQTFLSSRQRHLKRVCTNSQSEVSNNFVKAMKCIMDKRFELYRKSDATFANKLVEIHKLNFNDSALELKYLCCSIVELRRNAVDNLGTECQSYKETVSDMISSIIPNDLSLICEDEEKLLGQVCPTIKPLNVSSTFDTTKRHVNSPSTEVLYLIATLGEPDSL